jgi:hypothetical protein
MALREFLPPGRTGPETALLVDGFAPGWRHLSHWPGHATPKIYQAPTSTEMCLRWAADAGRETYIAGLSAVCNNHFDTDGLLSAWIVLNPDAALAERPHLLAAARAGDFGWYTSPKGVRLDLLVEAYAMSETSPLAAALRNQDDDERLAILYGELLPRLPALLHEIEEQRPLWEPGWKEIEAGFKIVRSGRGRFHDRPEASLSIYEGPPLPQTVRRSLQTYPRLLCLETRGDGRRDLRFEQDHYSWFDIAGNSRELRMDLPRLAEALRSAELGEWTIAGTPGFDHLESAEPEHCGGGGELVEQFISLLRRLDGARA